MTTVQTDVTNTTQLIAANEILRQLTEIASRNWMKVVKEVCEEDNVEWTIARIQETVEMAGRTSPVGAVVGSTVIAREYVNGDGELAAEALRMLKLNLRVYQIGRGRGRAIVVIDATPLDGDDAPTDHEPIVLPVAQVTPEAPAVQANVFFTTPNELDIDMSLLQVRDYVLGLQQRNVRLHAEVQDLRIQLEGALRRVQEVYEHLDTVQPGAEWPNS